MNSINLYRSNSDSNIHTLFLIGNGAIEDGNNTLLTALKKAQVKGFFKHNVSLIDDISSIAMVSCYERQMFDGLILYLKNRFNNRKIDIAAKYINALIDFISLRDLIAQEFKDNNHLKVRSKVLEHLIAQGIYQDSSTCATANWDNTLWNDENIKNLIHIHGHIDFPSSLIFPMQAIGERVLQAVLLDELKKETLYQIADKAGFSRSDIDELYKFYDVRDSNSIISKMHEAENKFTNSLQSARKIVIAGFAFNAYDHELMTAIAGVEFSTLDKVVIINKVFAEGYELQQKEIKAKKNIVRGLFKIDEEKIRYIDSENPLLSDDLNILPFTSHDQLGI